MLDMILQEARRLGVEERRRLIDLLRAQVFAELGRSGDADREPDACPRCGGTHLVRKGHDRDGSQRWARGSCGRTLSRKTMGLLGYPEPEEDVWASYVEHACAGGTPGECARACGVCPGTSWLVRMRLCEVMGRALAPFRSGPTVSCQVDGTYPGESLAGNRSGSRVGMPRRPPGVRPGAAGACVSRHDATPAREARPRRARHGGRDAREARPRRARHGGRDAREARGLPRAPRGDLDEEARPLSRLVPVGRAGEEVGRRQGGHPVGPGGDRRLRPHARRPREGAAAVLVLLGGETGHVNGGLTERLISLAPFMLLIINAAPTNPSHGGLAPVASAPTLRRGRISRVSAA